MDLPGDPGRIAFMHNATHALNTALWGLLDPDDVVVTSAYDHNAVLRPVHYLAEQRNVRVRSLGGAPDGSVDLEEAGHVLEGAKVLVINAVSNVLGTVMPVEQLAALARERGVLVVVDAAQHAGHIPGSLAAQGADVIAFTGHKGLLGPQGTGGLWVREGVEVRPLLCGGTGGDSTVRTMPAVMPDHLEAGTPNAPGLAGLLAGCEYVLDRGVAQLHEHESKLKARMRDGLEAIPRVRILSPPAPEGVGIVTFLVADSDPGALASALDRDFDVLCRSGLHCAPEVHALLGTAETGAVRFSLGWSSSQDDVDAACQAVEHLAAQPASASA